MSNYEDEYSERSPLLPENRSISQNSRSEIKYTNKPIISFSTPPRCNSQTHRSDTSSSLATLATETKMSDVRRTFCLFVTFDLIVTVLLWMIVCGVSSSTNIPFYKILHEQVGNLNVWTSFFDIVILACARFAFLEVAYAGIRIKHWWPVATSTVICGILLILKVLATFTTKDQYCNVPMVIVLLLTDFFFTWVEVWFIDSKVLPGEVKLAQKTAQAFIHQSLHSSMNDEHRNSFLQTLQQGNASERGAFYSPPESEHAPSAIESMYYSMRGRPRSGHQLTPQDSLLLQEGLEGLNKLWLMYQDESMWKQEKVVNNGDIVYSTENEEYGKSFKIEANVAIAPFDLFKEIIMKPEEMPEWNKTVADVKILQKIGEQTLISYEVSSPAAMGLISSRAFVTVRRVEKMGEQYVSAGLSTDKCENLVPDSNFVRGINGPTGFIVGPGNDGPQSCKFVWILNTDLKGNLSRSLVNRNLTSTLIEFVSAMRRRLGI